MEPQTLLPHIQDASEVTRLSVPAYLHIYLAFLPEALSVTNPMVASYEKSMSQSGNRKNAPLGLSFNGLLRQFGLRALLLLLKTLK